MTRFLVAGLVAVPLVIGAVALWDCGWWAGRLERERVLCGGAE